MMMMMLVLMRTMMNTNQSRMALAKVGVFPMSGFKNDVGEAGSDEGKKADKDEAKDKDEYEMGMRNG